MVALKRAVGGCRTNTAAVVKSPKVTNAKSGKLTVRVACPREETIPVFNKTCFAIVFLQIAKVYTVFF